MNKKEKITQQLQEIWYTLLNAKTSFYYSEYLFNPPTEKEKDYMRYYGLEMVFFRNVLWRNAIIELANLFKKTEKRSIEKFLNKVNKGGELSNQVPSEKVIQLRLRLMNHEDVINKVLEMRDKIFAHADWEYKIAKKYDVFDKDVEKLIVFAESFISEIFSVFNSGVTHNTKLLRDEFNILKILAEYEEEKHKKIIKEFTPDKLGLK